MTTTTAPTVADQEWAAKMADAAVREVARHAVAAAVRRNPPQWEDYPEIGAHDWEAIEAEVDRIVGRLAAQAEKYDCAYAHPASRAGGEA